MPENKRLFHRLKHRLTLKKIQPKQDSQQSLWWLITSGFGLLCLLFFISPLMRIRHINCATNVDAPCPDFILPALEPYRNQLIYTLNSAKIITQLMSVLPDIQEVRLKKTWPDTINLTLTSQFSLANLQIPASSSALILGNDFQITAFNSSPQPQLPTIVASSAASLRLGDRLTDEAELFAAQIITRLPQVQSVTIYSPLEIVASASPHRYIFTINKPIDTQVHSLQLILAQTTINTTGTIFDLRYDNPVIKQSW
jgi:cell division septal protein FtsQ